MTVVFSDLTTKTHGDYCNLSFSSNYGSGAAGVATTPGGCSGDTDPACVEIGSKCKGGEAEYGQSNRGPLSGVMLTEPGSCYARLGRVEPTLTAMASPGDGAIFEVSLFQKQDENKFDYWGVQSVSVSGGAGYVDGSAVVISRSVGDTVDLAAKATLSAQALVADKETGQITGGEPLSVKILEAGKYYRESHDATPYVAEITISPCGGGTGAEIKANVETNTKKKTFGQIASLSILNGGEDYLAWGWTKTCHDKANGVSLVLRANDPKPLVAACSASCYGSGATAGIVALGNREPPSISISGSGTKGSISVSLSQAGTEDGNEYRPFWTISSVSASGGKNYTSGPASISAPCATVLEAAEVELTATEIVTDPYTGKTSGGDLTGATVVKGGKYYIQRDYDGGPTPIKHVTLGLGGSGYAKLGRQAPEITLSTRLWEQGAGATFTPTLASKKDDCGVDYWFISKVAANGGSGYANGQSVIPTANWLDVTQSAASLSIVTKQPEDGQPPGQIESVTVTDGGKYYRESKTLTPYVASVEFAIDQDALSSGSGAKITGVVDSNPFSYTFGSVKKVKIEDHGSGYTLFGGSQSCTYSGGCASDCGVGSPQAQLTFRGTDKEPQITLADRTFRAGEKIADCRNLPASATVMHSSSGGSVTLTRGGLWNPTAAKCDDCASPSWEPLECTGTCTCRGDCGPGCACRNGRCDTCETSPDCGAGFVCVDKECVPEIGACCTIGISVFDQICITQEDAERNAALYEGLPPVDGIRSYACAFEVPICEEEPNAVGTWGFNFGIYNPDVDASGDNPEGWMCFDGALASNCSVNPCGSLPESKFFPGMTCAEIETCVGNPLP